MNKNEKLIMVIEREKLFGNDYFEGFKPNGEINYESRILANFTFKKRGLVEKDPSYKQPIAYCVIVNPVLKKVFAYQRSAQDARYSEKRLQGKWSVGLGGHIEKFESHNRNPIYASMLRELSEEVEGLGGSIKPRVLGYINDDSDDVGKVHFGILYIVETADEIKPKDAEIREGRLREMEELEKMLASSAVFRFEEWSRIAFAAAKRHLSAGGKE